MCAFLKLTWSTSSSVRVGEMCVLLAAAACNPCSCLGERTRSGRASSRGEAHLDIVFVREECFVEDERDDKPF